MVNWAGPPGPGWRRRWARAENRRRLRAYHAEMDEWHRRNGQLRALRAAVEWGSAVVAGDDGTEHGGLPVRLDPDEPVLAVAPATRLVAVRARHVAGTPGPERTPVPVFDGPLDARPPYGLRTLDGGLVVLTDRRVILVGRTGEREWSYRDLAGLGHHPTAPLTLLYKRGRRTVSGLLLPPEETARFRLVLTLAYTVATGRQTELLARIDGLIEAHLGSRPDRPVVAAAAAAPLRALVPEGVLVVGGALATAMLVVGALLMLPEGTDEVRGAASMATATPGLPPPSRHAASPPAVGEVAPAKPRTAGPALPLRPVAEPRLKDGGIGRTVTAPAPGGRRSASPSPTPSDAGTPSPTATPDPLCGAPLNPFGYTLCGGAYVTSPEADICDYFDCVDDFWTGTGYVVWCLDGMISREGDQPAACAGHGGVEQPVYV